MAIAIVASIRHTPEVRPLASPLNPIGAHHHQRLDAVGGVREELRSGVIKVDGNPVTLAGLSTALAQIKAKKGAVLYYREGPNQEPTEHQLEVFKEIVSARVPISMSSKPDFSDVIDENGHSRPRN